MKSKFWSLILFLCIITLSACNSGARNLKEGIDSFRVQNYRQAFIRLLPEAEKGQADAQYAIGYMYYYGQGVTENKEKAWYWINRAANAGQPDAIAATQLIRKVTAVENTFPTTYFPDRST